MVKRITDAPRRQAPTSEAPQKHTWHVVTITGSDETVTAHHCDHLGGVLAFSDYSRFEDNPAYLLVRAFAPGKWTAVELVNLSDIVAATNDTPGGGGSVEHHH